MMFPSNNKQAGLTLVELMVALVLGLLLVAGVIQVFISNNQTSRVTEAHSRLQDNARFALEILSKDVRSAGYSGCRAIENMNVVTIAEDSNGNPLPTDFMNLNTIIGGTDNWNLGVSASLGTVVPGTDVITLQSGSGCGANLVGNISNSGSFEVLSPNLCNLSQNDIVMISDCEDAHIFKISNNPKTDPGNSNGKQTVTHGSNHNISSIFCKSYDTGHNPNGQCSSTEVKKLYGFDAELFRFTATTYFIRLGTNGDPALWRYNISSGVATELVEGVENMQIVYGVDTNDDDTVDNYSNAQAVTAANTWDKVISARISLLTQTLERNLTTADQNVAYNGGTVTGEGRIRRVFTTTIGIRNRVQ